MPDTPPSANQITTLLEQHVRDLALVEAGLAEVLRLLVRGNDPNND